MDSKALFFGFRIKILLVAMVSGLIMLSCSTSNDIELKSITGKATVYNEIGDQLAESGGVEVSLTSSDSTTVSDRNFTTTTLDDGSYEFSEIPDGIYQLSFDRKGIASLLVPNIVVENNDLNNINVDLSELPTHSIETLEAKVVPNSFNNTDGSVASTALQMNLSVSNFLAEDKNVTRRLFRVFWGKNENVSRTNFEEMSILVAANDSPDVTLSNRDATFSATVPSALMNQLPSGARFYVAIYEATENNFFFVDPVTNTRIYANLSEEPVVSSVTNIIQ